MLKSRLFGHFLSSGTQKGGVPPPQNAVLTPQNGPFSDFGRPKRQKLTIFSILDTFFWFRRRKNGSRPAKRGVTAQHPRGGGRRVRSRRRFSHAPEAVARAVRVVISGPRNWRTKSAHNCACRRRARCAAKREQANGRPTEDYSRHNPRKKGLG